MKQKYYTWISDETGVRYELKILNISICTKYILYKINI